MKDRFKQSPPLSLGQMPGRATDAFREASPAKRAGMIAVGAALLASSPYWAPALWRSKKARRLAALGATQLVPKLFG